MTREEAKIRFVEVVLDKAVRRAKREFKRWPESKREDATQEFLAKCLDTWMRAVDRGDDPETKIGIYQIFHYAALWVRYDRKVAGRARGGPDVQDYRAGMKRQQLDSHGHASPTDRGDAENGWIDWETRSKEVDPADWAEAKDEHGML